MQFGKLSFFDFVIFVGLLTASIEDITGQSTCINGAKFLHYEKSKYRICIGGVWQEHNCENGQIFNPVTTICEIAVINPPCINGAKFPHPDKSKYNICIGGVWQEQNCPNGQIFDPVTTICKKPVINPDCGSLPAGSKAPIAGSDKDYYQCIDGNRVKFTCPDNLVFDPTLLSCRNPCSVYVPLPHSRIYYVGSPSSEPGYYKCTVSTPVNTPGPLQQCPSGTQFIQALGSLFGPDQFCINYTQLNKRCLANFYRAFPLLPNPYCGSTQLTPYYVLCNNGMASIQRCAVGSIVNESGYCKNMNFHCESNPVLPEIPGCICG